MSVIGAFYADLRIKCSYFDLLFSQCSVYSIKKNMNCMKCKEKLLTWSFFELVFHQQIFAISENEKNVIGLKSSIRIGVWCTNMSMTFHRIQWSHVHDHSCWRFRHILVDKFCHDIWLINSLDTVWSNERWAFDEREIPSTYSTKQKWKIYNKKRKTIFTTQLCVCDNLLICIHIWNNIQSLSLLKCIQFIW